MSMREYEITVKISTTAKFSKKDLKEFSDLFIESVRDLGFMCVETESKEVIKDGLEVENCPVCGHLWKDHQKERSDIEVPQNDGTLKKYQHWAIYCGKEDCTHRTNDLPFCFDSITPELVDYNPEKKE